MKFHLHNLRIKHEYRDVLQFVEIRAFELDKLFPSVELIIFRNLLFLVQESKLYGSHFREIGIDAPKSTKITFNNSDGED